MSRQVIDKVGKRFGNLVVLERAPSPSRGYINWLCECVCGARVVRRASNLSNHTKPNASCGCKLKERLTGNKHGRTHGLTGTPAYVMWGRVKHRAKKNDIPFDLSYEDIEIPTHCPVLGIPLLFVPSKLRVPSDNSPSLDRLDPSKGYVKGNVCVMSYRANMLKNNATAAELERIARWMRGAVL